METTFNDGPHSLALALPSVTRRRIQDSTACGIFYLSRAIFCVPT
jgi:hypothetical protein